MKKCYILVGPSGSGKTTWANAMVPGRSGAIVGLDQWRLQFYSDHVGVPQCDQKEFYRLAWEFCNKKSKEFSAYVKRMFAAVLERHNTVVVDNTNVSPKARRRWIEPAKANGFVVVGVVFQNQLDVLIRRQRTRMDKVVPDSAVTQQFNSVVVPTLEEVDSVITIEPGWTNYVGG